jgi:hypothetical protein
MMALFTFSTLIALGACGVAWLYRGAFVRMRKSRDYNRKWAWSLYRQAEATKARQSRAGKIARQAQIDRQRALRDNATAALQQGRAL